MTRAKKEILPALHDSGKVTQPDLQQLGNTNYTSTILRYANLAVRFPQLKTDAKTVVDAINEIRVIPNPEIPASDSYVITSQDGYAIVSQDGYIVTSQGASAYTPDLNYIQIKDTIYKIAGGDPYVLPIASDSTLGGIKVGSGLTINSTTGVLSAIPTPAATSLDELTDVDIENATDGQTLIYDGESNKWVNRDGGGDYSAGAGIYFTGSGSVINADAGRFSPAYTYQGWDADYTGDYQGYWRPGWVDSGTTEEGHTVYQSDAGTYMMSSGNSICTYKVGGYGQYTIYVKQNPETSGFRYVVFGYQNSEINLDTGYYDYSCQDRSDSGYISRTYYSEGGESFVQVMYHKEPMAQGVTLDLKNGQWVDTGTTVDGHTVYKSDAGSWHISNGSSICTLKIAGITSFTIYFRSSSESGYDWAYVGNLDTDVSRYSYKSRLSGETNYTAVTFECSSGEHIVQVMYAKDGSVDSYDDRGYFYYVINEYAPTPPDDDRAYTYIEVSNPISPRGEIFNDYEHNIALGDNAHAEGYGARAYGTASHSEGFSNTANGSYAHVEGIDNIAYGSASHVEGGQNQTLSEKSHAEGMDNIAGGAYSHVEGAYNKAMGERSHAEGYSTLAQGPNSHAEGRETTASGYRAHAEGYGSIASGTTTHAEGWKTQALSGQDHAEGYYSVASGGTSHAEGMDTKASGGNSHAEGHYTEANASSAHAEGEYSIAAGQGSHAEGYGDSTYRSVATGQGSHAEGRSTASNSFAHSEGANTLASGMYSHAEGYNSTRATAIGSHAEGNGTQASGNNSHAEGGGSIASGQESHAEGGGTRAYGSWSHSEGAGTKAFNSYSHVEGAGVGTFGVFTHAEGAGNIILANYGHIEGGGNISFGSAFNTHTEGGGNENYSPQGHIEGSGNTISGEESHGEGAGNRAHGPKNHSEGGGNAVYGIGSHVEGKHNSIAGFAVHAEGSDNLIGSLTSISQFDYGTNYNVGDIVGPNANYVNFNESTSAYLYKCITAPGQIQEGNGIVFITGSSWSSSTNYPADSVVYFSDQKGTGYFYCTSAISAQDAPPPLNGSGWTRISDLLSPFKSGTYSGYYLIRADQELYSGVSVAKVASNTSIQAMWEPIPTPHSSHVEGLGNISTGDYQHVEGKYNEDDDTKAFIIGNGTKDANNEITRSNALTVDWSGNLDVAGDVGTGVALDTVAQTLGAAINEIVDEIPSVSVTQIQSTGTKIATVTIDSTSTDLYAPTGGGSSTLAGLSDVTITSATSGQVLTYNGSDWENAAVPSGSSTLAGLTDVSLTTPTNGQVLKYDSTSGEWVNANETIPTTPSLDNLTNVSINTPSNGQVLTYDSSSQEWINSSVSTPDAEDVAFDDTDVEFEADNVQDAFENITKTLTWAEYQALTDVEKNNGTIYFISDINGDGQDFQPVIYSEEEREIGVWKDGKPLYEKTIARTFDADEVYTVFASGIDIAFIQSCFFEYTSGRYMSPYYMSSTNVANNISLNSDVLSGALTLVNQTRTARYFYVTVRYTKTADQAGSGTWTPQGVPAVHYSTDEQIVGTWVDGKTIYEKTVYVGALTVDSSDHSVAHNIQNFDRLIDFTATGRLSSSSTNRHVSFNFYRPGSTNGSFFMVDNTSVIYMNNWDAQIVDVYITIRYTKSSS